MDDSIMQDDRYPAAIVAAAVAAELTEEEKRDLADMTRHIGDPQAARRVLDAKRATTFAELEDLAPGFADPYRARAFAELHGPEHGGTWSPDHPVVALDDLGRRLAYADRPLTELTAIGCGPAHPLNVGLMSLTATSDDVLGLCADGPAERMQVTAWTIGSQVPFRRWWLRATFAQPDDGAATATWITLAVAATEYAASHPATVFTDQSGALLGEPVTTWLIARRDGGGFRPSIRPVDPGDVPTWTQVVNTR